MKNRFIVLIDFSSYSEHLLRFAYDWSKRINAEILLVHNTNLLTPVWGPLESKIELINIANRDALEKLRVYSETFLPKGTSVNHFVSEENLVTMLRQLLQKPFNNLVFLGIKGTGSLKKIFIGSQSVKVIDNIDNLIVAVPKNIDSCSLESVHVAFQKSHPLNIIELNKFLKFAGEKLNKIKFFSIITPDDNVDSTEEYLKEVSKLYSSKRDTSYEIYKGDNALINLKNIISKNKNEFIVVQRGSRMFLDKFFRKFIINELVY
jgi:hypothetical protein